VGAEHSLACQQAHHQLSHARQQRRAKRSGEKESGEEVPRKVAFLLLSRLAGIMLDAGIMYLTLGYISCKLYFLMHLMKKIIDQAADSVL